MNAARQGENILYTADVRIFSEHTKPSRLPTGEAKRFFDVLDERGRSLPLLQNGSFIGADVTLNHGGSVKSSLSFLAPANARTLFAGPPWAYPRWAYLAIRQRSGSVPQARAPAHFCDRSMLASVWIPAHSRI